MFHFCEFSKLIIFFLLSWYVGGHCIAQVLLMPIIVPSYTVALVPLLPDGGCVRGRNILINLG